MKKIMLSLALGLGLMLLSGLSFTLSAADSPAPTMQVKEVPATFGKGSLAEFQQWVTSQLTYPAVAREEGIQGRVVVQFIVDKEGKVTNVTVLESPSDLLSNEVLRVMAIAPRWNPGMRDGQPMATRYTMPLTFKFE